MDDTPRRVKTESGDLSGRSSERVGNPADETARNYASSTGAVAEPAPDIVTPSRVGSNTASSIGANDVTSASSNTSTSASIDASTSGSDGEEDADLNRRTSQIRGEIEQTREEMTETIDAIQEKLRPANIVANATDRVKQATTERVRSMADMASGTANEMMDYGRDAYGAVAGEVRQNPIPLAMIGIGAAWLLMGRNTSRAGSRRPAGWNPRSAYSGGPYDDGLNYGQAYGQTYDDRQNAGLWRRANQEQHGRAPTRTDDYGATSAGSWSSRGDQGNGGVMGTISANPIPTALAAMGIAWLAFNHKDDGWTGSSGDDDRWRQQYRDAQRRGVGWTGTNTGSGGSDSEGAGGTSAAQQYAERAKDYASGVTSRARDVANEAGERASEYAERAQDYAGEAMQTVQRRGRQAQNELQRMMNDNPLLVGAGAMALGAVIGMALPETEKENEWMGETRDQVLDRAQDMARDAASKVQEAAGDMAGEVASRVVSGDKDK